VQGRDRRLHDVVAASAQGQGSIEHRPPVGDLRRVPERAVLVGEPVGQQVVGGTRNGIRRP